MVCHLLWACAQCSALSGSATQVWGPGCGECLREGGEKSREDKKRKGTKRSEKQG